MMITSCEKDDEDDQIVMLHKTWIESHEEKTSEAIEIYRPGDYKDFPFSWYRQAFNFGDNNQCDYSVLAANDGHYMESGSWEYNDTTNIIQIFNSGSDLIYEFEVVELTHELLKLKAKN